MTLLLVARFTIVLSVLLVPSLAHEQCAAAKSLSEQNDMRVAARFLPPHAAQSGTATSVPGCLVLKEPWWTYELCIGKWVRQFHEEGGAIVSEYFLGRAAHAYKDDFYASYQLRYVDGTRTVPTQLRAAALRNEIQNAEVVQKFSCRDSNPPPDTTDIVVDTVYGGGSVCEGTRQPRLSRVVFVCTAGAFPLMLNMSETKTCEYLFYVFGPAVCDMMGAEAPAVAHRGDTSAKAQETPPPAAMDATPQPMSQRKDAPKPIPLPEELLLFAL
jgi:hypothetical protein